ncbi:extensin-like [Coccinella septempunctata]|uniref:extensin-like n=1 Tax=Coccinella septempunctata TaxID=41139 RepID=UPI001D079BEB|nr:extensin-like [Coccinella septempunctata]
MKLVIVVLACFLYGCQAGVTRNADVVIDGKNETLPDVTVITTEATKNGSSAKTADVSFPVGPVISTTTIKPSPTPKPTDPTPKPTDPTPPTPKPTDPTPPTPKPTDPTPKPTDPTTSTPKPTDPTTPTTPKPSPTPKPTTPTTPTTKKPIPSSTTAPVTTTTVSPPSNRGFDGPSFIGGIVLASGLMAIGFVALKFYRARTELNYHTL